MLDRLLPHVEHKQLAAARDGDGWGILMRDLTGSTFNWNTPFSAEMVRTFLDVMARIHATFWNDAGLDDAAVGLCTPAQLLDMTALPVAGKLLSHGSGSPIPEWIRGGWATMPSILDPEIFKVMRDLIEDPQPLFGAVRRYPVTLLHGDYRTVNLAYTGQSCPVVYDWQEATASLMTIDLAWFVKYDYAPDEISVEQAVSFYRDRLESHLGTRFDDREWQAMLDLGGCFDALRSACFGAYFYSVESDPKRREFNERLVNRQGQFVRNALRWL
jgi:hypothetical protein